MKKKEYISLKAKATDELKKEVVAKKADLAKFTAKMFAGGEKDLKKGRNLKKEIAQILTVITEKGFVEAESKKTEKTIKA
jgi:ribosomal protein L29